jgi:glycosyltransferase involved in cell wall biosynthesis
MKILYVKNNSERAKEFQLKTIIYEENGKKYVKKESLTAEATPHLKRMKESYEKLSKSTLNPNIEFAKIIDEDENSLTFEFIEGISFEKKFEQALLAGKSSVEKLLQEYVELLKLGFKMTEFKSETMATDEFKTIFGDLDYSCFNGDLCFEGISSIDLIFSNIIYKDDKIYFIDYEWAYSLNIPVDYIIHRTFEMLSTHHRNFKNNFANDIFFYHKMERHFVDNYAMRDGFYFQKKSYIKENSLIEHLALQVEGKEEHIQELSTKIHAIGEDLAHARNIVEHRDGQIEEWMAIVETLYIKNRVKQFAKRVIGKFMPSKKVNTNMEKSLTSNKLYGYKTPELTALLEDELSNFKQKPLISIVMPVYDVDPKWLSLAINSIEAQWYENWELCIADDKSPSESTVEYLKSLTNPKIKVTFLEKNLNISGATNAALELASGDYIALMDNDDEITPDALYEMVKAINEHNAEFIYSDEDFISTEGKHTNPHFKPDFSPDLLLSHNYITHFTCFKKELLDRAGYFNPEFDGSQDYDLFLRLTEKTSKIYHIQKVLYHWRMLETSTSANSEAKPEAIERGRVVVEEALKRRGIKATVEHGNMHHYFRVKYNIEGNPLVSIVIPFKDKPELLDMSINSILEKSTYKNYEIIGISNNSEEPETFKMMAELEKKDTRVSFHEYNVEFNYADINNYAIKTYAKGEHVLLLNNDIEIISPEWIESMLELSQREDVGCVGAKLYYPDDTIQHAGIIIGLGGYAGHSHKLSQRDSAGYFNRLSVVQNLSAVTAACLMIKKSIYEEVNGMDEVRFKVAYNDVDFCLRVLEKGYLNIFTPFAQMYHHESISRGYETTPEKIARFQKEKDALSKRHNAILTKGDPYYNPNLTHDKENFSIAEKHISIKG